MISCPCKAIHLVQMCNIVSQANSLLHLSTVSRRPLLGFQKRLRSFRCLAMLMWDWNFSHLPLKIRIRLPGSLLEALLASWFEHVEVVGDVVQVGRNPRGGLLRAHEALEQSFVFLIQRRDFQCKVCSHPRPPPPPAPPPSIAAGTFWDSLMCMSNMSNMQIETSADFS